MKIITEADGTKSLCVNRIIVEGLFNSGFKNGKEIAGCDGVNPEYIEILINSTFTEIGKERLIKYVSDNSNKDIETLSELREFFNLLPSQELLTKEPIVAFWSEN